MKRARDNKEDGDARGILWFSSSLFSALTEVCKHAWKIMWTFYVLTGGSLTPVSQKPDSPVHKAKAPALNPRGPWQMQGPR